MATKELKIAAVVLVSMAVGFLLAGGGVLPKASGQGEGMTSGVICVVGEQYTGYAPIVVVDVPDQSVLVYEYSYSARQIRLTSARTFRFDKLLTDFQTAAPTVEEVRKRVTR
jgi:hypothetical protein